jgi:hypothetical protein
MIHGLGRQRVRRDPRRNPGLLHLRSYLKGELPMEPLADWGSKIPQNGWGMCLNDQLGDCVIAWMAHHILCMTANTSAPVVIPDADVQATYSAITGYDPSKTDANGNNPTDQGTDMQDALNYWQNTGIAGHKILGWVSFDWTNPQELQAAKYIFGGGGFGVNLPTSAEAAFNADQPWTDTTDQNILGGHAIYGSGDTAAFDDYVTWGQEISAAPAWTQAYVEESYIVVSEDWLASVGTSPSGLNLSALMADLALVKL